MTTLAGTLPETQVAFNALDQYARTIGVSIAIADFGGVRTQSDTTKILQYRQDDFNAARSAGTIRPDTTLQQFRPIAQFGKSYHNYGAAFDVQIIARPSNLSADQAMQMLGRYAPNIGLRWGGTFSNPDTPHFELAIPIADAQARYRAFAASGGASSPLPGSFDFSAFLPGMAPTSDDIEATLAAPDVYSADDDAGDVALAGSDQSPMPLLAFGLLIAGVMAWALRRKFFSVS